MAPVKRIGKYDVIETIGRGGMGIVFKATDPVLGRLVAIKMMTDGFADNPDLLKRFYREAQSTAILSHPNIVTVYDMGAHDGMPYLVMQFLEGESLDAIIQSRRELSLLTKTNYIVQICYGLQYAHEQGITHRDIKPANIMVLPDGTVKIVDFGIARIGNDRMTRPGQVMGSFYYMSPEQINEREVDARSDIFALGTVAYEFLTLALPFQGQDMFSTISKILNDPPPSLAAYLQDYPVELDAILERALAKDKEDRYQTVDELAFDLARVETQLNKEMVANLLEEAERLTSEGDLAHAREQLRQLIKLDPQNPSASLRMREVQQEIQKQRRNEHARQLRAEAEQFVAQQDFDTALRLVNQAIALEPGERELKDLRDSVGEKRALHLLLRECMGEAGAARKAGNLAGALGSLERLLAAQPHDANALRLKDEIEVEVAERDKQRLLQQLIAEARQQILSRKLTGALQTVKQVENLDGDSPALRELLHRATEGVEQELRRRAVERAAAEVTAALDLPDPSLAHNLAATALEKFSGEQGLLQLQAKAKEQIEADERHQWLVEQMTSARTLLEAGESAKAMAVLESAWQKHPGDGDLESLMSSVRAAIEQELAVRRRVEQCTSMAKDAMRRKDYAEAIKTLEEAKSETESNRFDELLQQARDEASDFEHKRNVELAAAQAQQIIDGGDYQRAVEFLESTLRELPDEDLRSLAANARKQLADYWLGLDHLIATANQLAAEGRPTEAVSHLEAHRATYNREPRFKIAAEEASQQQQTKEAIGRATAAIRAELAAGEFETAQRKLGAALRELGNIDEMRQLEEELQAQRALGIQKEMETVLGEAEKLFGDGAEAEALARLQSAASLVDRVPLDLRSRYDDLRGAISRRLEAANRQRVEREAALQMAQRPEQFDRGWWSSEPEAAAGQPPPIPPGATALMGESRSSLSPLRAELRDKSVLELTPPEGMVLPRKAPLEVIATGMGSNSTGAGGSDYNAATSLRADSEIGGAPPPPVDNVRTGSGATSDASGWPIDTLRTVEKQLANFIGSLARIMVKRAAARTTDPEELYSILAASLESKADREAFLAKKAELKRSLTNNRLPPEPLPAASSVTSPNSEAVELTSAAVDHAARMLARHIGPIANVLTKKAAQRADSLRTLYLLLAKYVENGSERSRFLREAGFSD